MKTIILLCIIHAYNTAATSAVKQSLINEPRNITSEAGSFITLPCRIGKKEDTCQWTKDGVDPLLSSYPRLIVRDCNLDISPLLPSDEGVYQCEAPGVPGVSRPLLLIVTAEPGQPYITQATMADVITVKKGQEVILQCRSGGGKPPADITWLDDTGAVIEDGVDTKIVQMEDGKTFKSISTLQLTPVSDTEITCSAQNIVFPSPKTSAILIKHLQKPKVYLDLGSPEVHVGDSLNITCNTDAYPESVRYRWYVNGQVMGSEKSATMMINNITKTANKVRIKCKAVNRVGWGESEIILDVKYAPAIINHPQDIIARTGETVIFRCLAESNPAPAYVWLREETREVVGLGAEMSRTAAETDEMFVCKVFSEGFKEVESSSASLQVIRRPRIISVDEGEMEDDFMLHCVVESVAKKTKISWIVNDTPIDISDNDYETIYNEEGIFHHSFLVFKQKSKKYEDHACFVSNEAGTDYKANHVTSDQNYSVIVTLLAIFLTILITMIVLSILITHIRQKNSSAEHMEKEKQVQKTAVEAQPCLGGSSLLDKSFISPRQSFNSSFTSGTAFTRSFSLDQSRTGRRIGF